VTSLLFAARSTARRSLHVLQDHSVHVGRRQLAQAVRRRRLKGVRRSPHHRRRHRRGHSRSRQEARRARARQLAEKGVKAIKVPAGSFTASIWRRICSIRRRRNLRRAARRSPSRPCPADRKGLCEVPISTSIISTIGPYIRTTLTRGQTPAREALFDIYRVMRPGEAATVRDSRAMFHLCSRPRALRSLRVGRVKMNMRLDLDARTRCACSPREIIASCARSSNLRDGRGEIRRHRSSRQSPRAFGGELMENQYRLGLLRMERPSRAHVLGRHRHVMPQDLINAKPGRRRCASSSLVAAFAVQWIRPIRSRRSPISAVSRRWARAPDARTRGLLGARPCTRPLWPHLPIETPEGPNIASSTRSRLSRASTNTALSRRRSPRADSK